MSFNAAQYSVLKAGSIATRLAGYQRRKMYRAFLAMGIAPTDTILEVGATSDRTYDHSNYLVAWYPYKDRITASGVDEGAAFLTRTHPGVRFVRADGRRLPFADGSYDFVHSSAVIEHVGRRGEQATFVAEAWRVARKGVFLTTPNRWFPVEFHTTLPLLHWLPPALFRAILRGAGLGFFADERNLNLLGARALRGLCAEAGLTARCHVTGMRLGGWVANLRLVLDKRPGAAGCAKSLLHNNR